MNVQNVYCRRKPQNNVSTLVSNYCTTLKQTDTGWNLMKISGTGFWPTLEKTPWWEAGLRSKPEDRIKMVRNHRFSRDSVDFSAILKVFCVHAGLIHPLTNNNFFISKISLKMEFSIYGQSKPWIGQSSAFQESLAKREQNKFFPNKGGGFVTSLWCMI